MLNLKKFINNRFTIIILLIIFIASTWSLYNNQFFRVHDYTHGARIAEMAISLKEGRFPVRWSPDFGFGFGMPLFNFYAPLPYYLAGIFFNLGFSLVFTIKFCLYFLPTLITLLGSYQLGKKTFGSLGGIILAAAYTLAPYRAVNMFVRGALGEIWAMAFLPWVIYALIDSLSYLKNKKHPKKSFLLLACSLLGIILSHNLTALMFIPLSALFSFILYFKANKYQLKNTLNKLWPVVIAYLLSFLLSAFYVFPSFMEKDFTKIDFIFSGYFEYHHHFLYIRQFFQRNWGYGGSAWGPEDGISFFLGWGQIFALFSLLILFIKFILKNKKNLKKIANSKDFFYSLLFGFFGFLPLFMAILKSKFLWDKLNILQYIQFPWRWLTVASLFLAILVALSIQFFKNKSWRYFYGIILFILLLINSNYFKPESYLESTKSLYYSDHQRIQNEMSGVLPDYIPAQMAEEKVLQEANQNYLQIWPNDKNTNVKDFVFHVDRSHEKLLELNLSEETIVNFKIAYFPGWIAEINGETTDIIVNQELGNIQVLVPSGNSKVGLYFSEKTLARTLGNSLSIIGLIIFFLYFSPFAELKNKKRLKIEN